MQAFEGLAEVSKTLQNNYVGDWKDQGKKVVGYVCTYMPEEILYAADILPFRIFERKQRGRLSFCNGHTLSPFC